jgi:hypothetical protein
VRTSFDIALSRPLTVEQFAAAVGHLASTLHVTVQATDDVCWPCTISCQWQPATPDLEPYPDLRIAAELWKQYRVNSLCDVYPFAGEFDPHDPYWWLACIDGQRRIPSSACHGREVWSWPKVGPPSERSRQSDRCITNRCCGPASRMVVSFNLAVVSPSRWPPRLDCLRP